MDLLAMARREAVHVRIGCGDRVDPPREQSVDAAQHGILLMDQGRDAIPLRGEKGRQGGVAAKADHGGRTEGLIKARGHGAAGEDVLQRLDPADRTAAETPGGEDMDLHALEQAGEAGRSEEHTSELPSLMRSSYAVF